MKRSRKVSPFNWSRHPSNETISRVYLADPTAMTGFGKSITKDEFCNSLSTYTKIISLEQKKRQLRDLLFMSLTLIPIFFFLYNIFIGVSR